MNIVLSFGQGVKRPQARRVSVDNVPVALADVDPGEETWWSGHLWTGDSRRNAAWESTSVITIDLDHQVEDPKTRAKSHAAPEPEIRARLDDVWATDCPGSFWHHTPNGARIGYVLARPITTTTELDAAINGACALATRALMRAGVFVPKNAPGSGYCVDPAALDRAHFMFLPNAIVFDKPTGQKIARNALVYAPEEPVYFTPEELASSAPGGYSPALGAISMDAQLATETATIADALAKLEADGEHDGSMALMRVARAACTFGVETAERFLEVVAKWNSRRKAGPWDPDELARRFEDALTRYTEEGLAQVPHGKYRRVSLRQILETDVLVKGRFAFDEIENTVRIYMQHPPPKGPSWDLLTSEAITDIEVKICARYGWADLKREKLEDDIRSLAQDLRQNRVTDYLRGLQWDGVPRIDAMADRAHVAPKHLAMGRKYFRKMMIKAVRRAFKPGCKVDTMLVMVGPEMFYKSTLISILAGADNFSDTKINLQNQNNDRYMQIQSIWLYEWSELEGMTSKADVASVKSFMSSATDRYRAPFARDVRPHPRRGIFIGTSNAHDLVFDRDSNRRFWIVRIVGPIELAWFEAHRDQLWAEAVVLEETGENHWLELAEEDERRIINREFTPDDPLVEQLRTIIETERAKSDYKGWIPVLVLYRMLSLESSRTSNVLKASISTAMLREGFERDRGSKYGQGNPTVYVDKRRTEH
jgi:hypothetical protein